MAKKSGLTVVPDNNDRTQHVKVFYGKMEEAQEQYNVFMDDHYDDIGIVENKSFYVCTTDGGLNLGLIVYYITQRLKPKE